jgi:transposase
MQMNSNGQVQRSAVEWSNLMARYRQRGLGSRQFCEAEGLALRTFEKWYGRIRRSETSKGKFVEVKAPGGQRSRGRSKWNSRRACGCGCEARAMWFTPEVRRILAYSNPVAWRKSIDGLVGVVKSVLEEDPVSGSLFGFVNRRGKYVTLVSWDRTGWCLFAKRLEHGRFHFAHAEAKPELSRQVFQLLLDGIALGGRH